MKSKNLYDVYSTNKNNFKKQKYKFYLYIKIFS